MPETYTGDEGDDALAAGMPVMDGNEDRRDGWKAINLTRDLIATLTVLKSAVTTVGNALLAAANAGAARLAIGIDLGTANAAAPNKVPVYNASSQLTTADPTLGGHAASKQYVDAAALPTDPTFGNVTANGAFYTPNSIAAVSSYTIAYINGDGRLSRGASSLKYKENITDVDPAAIDGLFATPLREFEMIGGDGSRIIGYIAEEMAESEDGGRFVVRVDGEIESIDFIQLLLAQVANLNARLAALEER